jgi:hypothetical protein
MAAPVRFDPWVTLQNIQSRSATTATPATNRQSVAVLASVAAVHWQNLPGEAVTDADSERAAIIEYEAGVPRDWAEGYAKLLRLPSPKGVSGARWRTFLDDCGAFLDRWAAQAASLGWRAEDLFGISEIAPVARVDLAGLLWLLEGRELVALTASSAAIKTASGGVQTYRRTRGLSAAQWLPWKRSMVEHKVAP